MQNGKNALLDIKGKIIFAFSEEGKNAKKR